MQPKTFQSGDPLTAADLNEISRRAGQPVSAGPGLIVGGGGSGQFLAARSDLGVVLVRAYEDFEVDEHFSSGLVVSLAVQNRDQESSDYGQLADAGHEFKVFDPAKTEVKEDDQFYIAFNKQTGRFERISNKQETAGIWVVGQLVREIPATTGGPPSPLGPINWYDMRVEASSSARFVGRIVRVDSFYRPLLPPGIRCVAHNWSAFPPTEDFSAAEFDEDENELPVGPTFISLEIECVG
jgi:hypothetical protein